MRFTRLSLIALAALLPACRSSTTAQPTTPPTTPIDGSQASAPHIPTVARPVHECRAASDCTLVAVDCCDCAHGGSQTAIARAQLAAYDAQHAYCRDRMCPAVVSNHPTCALVADCQNERCMLANTPTPR